MTFAILQWKSPNPEDFMGRYVSSDHLTPAAIRAGMDNGTLRLWRIGAGGVKWFENADELPMIRGVAAPTDDEIASAIEAVDADEQLAEQLLAQADDDIANIVMDFEARCNAKASQFLQLDADLHDACERFGDFMDDEDE